MITENAPLYLSGQTGSGKTAVALALAKTLGPVEIINADAYQVYSGLEILTAPLPRKKRNSFRIISLAFSTATMNATRQPFPTWPAPR